MFVAYQLLELRDNKVGFHGVTPFYFSAQEMVVPMLFHAIRTEDVLPKLAWLHAVQWLL